MFLDISYSKNVTDEGISHFENRHFPKFNSLSINGCTGITSKGLNLWLKSFAGTLLDLECALCDQDDFKADFFESLGMAVNLETLDLTGCYAIDDAMAQSFDKGQAQAKANEDGSKPGLQECHTVKFCGLGISDITLMNFAKAAPAIAHLEITKCEKVTDFGLKSILETLEELAFIDINNIPAITYPVLDELKTTHPQLLIKRHQYQDVDFKKDNGLRVPRKLLVDIKKKKKGKKGKGKKKK